MDQLAHRLRCLLAWLGIAPRFRLIRTGGHRTYTPEQIRTIRRRNRMKL